jgi:hypothetical protein
MESSEADMNYAIDTLAGCKENMSYLERIQRKTDFRDNSVSGNMYEEGIVGTRGWVNSTPSMFQSISLAGEYLEGFLVIDQDLERSRHSADFCSWNRPSVTYVIGNCMKYCQVGLESSQYLNRQFSRKNILTSYRLYTDFSRHTDI